MLDRGQDLFVCFTDILLNHFEDQTLVSIWFLVYLEKLLYHLVLFQNKEKKVHMGQFAHFDFLYLSGVKQMC